MQTQGRHFGDAVHVRVVNRADVRNTTADTFAGFGIDDAVANNAHRAIKDVIGGLFQLNAGETLEVIGQRFILFVGHYNIGDLLEIPCRIPRVVGGT